MKRRKLLFQIVLFLLPLSSTLPQIIQVEEYNRQGYKVTIDFKSRSIPIVDINSTLHIQIDKNLIRSKISDLHLYDQSYNLTDLSSITEILKKESELIGILGRSVESSGQRQEKLKIFSRSMNALLEFIMKQESMRRAANDIYGAGFDESKTYSLIMALVREEIKKVIRDLDKSLKEQRVNFRLGGWVRSNSSEPIPIHIPQFDTYSEGKFYEVPRFTMPAPEELRNQYKEASEAASEYNEKGIIAFNGIKEQIGKYSKSFNATFLCIENGFKNVLDSLRRIEKIKKEVEPFMDLVDRLVNDFKNIAGALEKIKEYKDPLEVAPIYLDEIVNLSAGIKNQTKEISDSYKPFLNKLRAKVKAELKKSIEEQLAESQNCLDTVQRNIGELSEFMEVIQKWSGLAFAENMKLNLELTDKVNGFLLEDIPESTQVDLRYLGQRSENDEIYFKALLEKKSDPDAKQNRSFELDYKSLTMFRIDWFAELSAGVVFIDPVTGTGLKLTKQFQAAPSYSLLFKWGSRKSYIYNRFWRIGLGVNVAAPDFDLDSTPEIGLGITMTTALDYLQIGFGRNLGADVWYWFFGLRLPIGTVTLTEGQDASLKKLNNWSR